MKNIIIPAFLFLLALTFGSPVVAADAAGAYQLRPGDTVLVSVWREDALNREVHVLPDGSIGFPLVGRVKVAGLSAPDVEQRIAEKLKQYISEPVVTVVVTGIEGNRVYVLGKVNTPGPVVLLEPMNALQAISLAGGLNTFADGNGIQVLRPNAGSDQLLPVRYNDLIRGRDLQTNVPLKAGDTILVP